MRFCSFSFSPLFGWLQIIGALAGGALVMIGEIPSYQQWLLLRLQQSHATSLPDANAAFGPCK